MKRFKILVCCMVGVLILGSGIYVATKFVPKRVSKVTSITYPSKMMEFVDKMLEVIHAKAAYAEEKDPALDLLLQGLEYFRQHNFDKAMEYFQKVVNDYPDSPYAPHALGCIGTTWSYKYIFETGETKKEYLVNAIAVGKKLINTYPEAEHAVIAYAAIAATYAELEDRQNAVTYFEQALEKYKEKNFPREDIVQVIGALAYNYCLIEKFEEAFNLFQKLLTEYSDTERFKSTEGAFYQALGIVYASLEEPNYDEAIKCYKLALEKKRGLRGRFDIPTFLIAETYHYGKGDIENAKIWYKKLVDNYSKSEFYEEAKKRLEELEK